MDDLENSSGYRPSVYVIALVGLAVFSLMSLGMMQLPYDDMMKVLKSGSDRELTQYMAEANCNDDVYSPPLLMDDGDELYEVMKRWDDSRLKAFLLQAQTQCFSQPRHELISMVLQQRGMVTSLASWSQRLAPAGLDR